MKIEIKYGVIIGVLLALWNLTEYAFGFHSKHIEIHAIVTNFFIIIPIIFLILGIREKRDKELKGELSYWQGVKTGLLISLVTAVLAVIFLYLYHNYINPYFFSDMIEYTTSKAARENPNNPEAIELARTAAVNYFTLTSYLIQGFFGSIIFGTVISLVVPAVLRRKKS